MQDGALSWCGRAGVCDHSFSQCWLQGHMRPRYYTTRYWGTQNKLKFVPIIYQWLYSPLLGKPSSSVSFAGFPVAETSATAHRNIRRHNPEHHNLHTSLYYTYSWALLEKMPVAQLLKYFSTFYGTRRFITVFTRALAQVPILSQINPVHTTLTYFSRIHFNIIISTSKSS
jgi:hypothetical protein